MAQASTVSIAHGTLLPPLPRAGNSGCSNRVRPHRTASWRLEYVLVRRNAVSLRKPSLVSEEANRNPRLRTRCRPGRLAARPSPPRLPTRAANRSHRPFGGIGWIEELALNSRRRPKHITEL